MPSVKPGQSHVETSGRSPPARHRGRLSRLARGDVLRARLPQRLALCSGLRVQLSNRGRQPQPASPGHVPRQVGERRAPGAALLRGALSRLGERSRAQPRPPPVRGRRRARLGRSIAGRLPLEFIKSNPFPQRDRARHLRGHAALEVAAGKVCVARPAPARERLCLRSDRSVVGPRFLERALRHRAAAAVGRALASKDESNPARWLRCAERLEPLAQLHRTGLCLVHAQQRLPHHPAQEGRPHGSELGEAHQREVASRIDPRLEEPSLLAYLGRTYLVQSERHHGSESKQPEALCDST